MESAREICSPGKYNSNLSMLQINNIDTAINKGYEESEPSVEHC
jgi:hypothetical protein